MALGLAGSLVEEVGGPGHAVRPEVRQQEQGTQSVGEAVTVPQVELHQEQQLKPGLGPESRVQSTHTTHTCSHLVGLRLCVNVAAHWL